MGSEMCIRDSSAIAARAVALLIEPDLRLPTMTTIRFPDTWPVNHLPRETDSYYRVIFAEPSSGAALGSRRGPSRHAAG